jgi:hypothetical protein
MKTNPYEQMSIIFTDPNSGNSIEVFDKTVKKDSHTDESECYCTFENQCHSCKEKNDE